MKCLLVSYERLGANSTEHVVSFGCAISALGWEVQVALPGNSQDRTEFSFYKCSDDGLAVPLIAETADFVADVVHLWTPRAPIWRFIELHRKLIGGVLVLHLEDDEIEVLRSMGAFEVSADGTIDRKVIRALALNAWTHPTLGQCLAHAVDGITILNPNLRDLVPVGKKWLHVVPPARRVWFETDFTIDTESLHGEARAIVYSGAVHPAVAPCFFELCRAVKMLSNSGSPISLVRSGPPLSPDIKNQAIAESGHFLDLGLLPESQFHKLLSEAVVLVQPGLLNRFNLSRLPAKIVPYLLSGSPTVMPSFYDWLGVKDGEHALLFENGTADCLAQAISKVLDSPDFAREMGSRARAFAEKKFKPTTCGKPLVEFYQTLPCRSNNVWHRLRKPRIELPLELLKCRPTNSKLSTQLLARTALEEFRHPPHRSRQKSTVSQLFRSIDGKFSEAQSQGQTLLSRQWSRLRFGPATINPRSILRFDPGNTPGLYDIAGIAFRNPRFELLFLARPGRSPRPDIGEGGSTLVIETEQQRIWRWLATGTDPQIVMQFGELENAVFAEIWIRWDPLD